MTETALHLKKAITTTQGEVLGSNPRRVHCLLQNFDSVETIDISLGVPAAAGDGIRLPVDGGAYEINLTNPWHGSIYAVGSGNADLSITEVSL